MVKRDRDPDGLLYDIELDELSMLDHARVLEARHMKERGEPPVSVWGEQMSYGMYALARRGLLNRLARVVVCGEVPESMIVEIDSWSDDDVRAWLTRWAREASAESRAQAGYPARRPERGES